MSDQNVKIKFWLRILLLNLGMLTRFSEAAAAIQCFATQTQRASETQLSGELNLAATTPSVDPTASPSEEKTIVADHFADTVEDFEVQPVSLGSNLEISKFDQDSNLKTLLQVNAAIQKLDPMRIEYGLPTSASQQEAKEAANASAGVELAATSVSVPATQSPSSGNRLQLHSATTETVSLPLMKTHTQSQNTDVTEFTFQPTATATTSTPNGVNQNDLQISAIQDRVNNDVRLLIRDTKTGVTVGSSGGFGPDGSIGISLALTKDQSQILYSLICQK